MTTRTNAANTARKRTHQLLIADFHRYRGYGFTVAQALQVTGWNPETAERYFTRQGDALLASRCRDEVNRRAGVPRS